ncbi:MAG: serine/threonine protein kinase [Lachnospiraceae bacterium]
MMIGERYRLEQLLSSNAHTKVYKSWDMLYGRYVIIKQSGIMNRALRLESSFLQQLDFDCFPRYLNSFYENDQQYLVMEYCNGENLLKVIRTRSVTEDDLLDWMIDTCKCFELLSDRENPIIHQDIKPENILLTYDDEIKIIDFGIAKFLSSGTEVNRIALGSRKYAAPEQFGRGKDILTSYTDIRSDIYSFGATFLTLYKELGYVIFPELMGIISKCMQSLPVMRYQSFSWLRRDLLKCRKKLHAWYRVT